MANVSEIAYFANRDNNSGLRIGVIINCALNASLMPISIIGNILVLAAISRTPSLRSPSAMFLCSLAMSDLLVGLVVQPVYIVNELTHNLLFDIRNVMAFSVCAVSLTTMTAISVDRFLALHYHMRYQNLITTQRAAYISATLWLINVLLSLSFWNITVYIFTGAISIGICLVLSTVCYISIFRVVRRHQLQIHVQQQAVGNLDAESNFNMQRSKKSSKNTFIYYIVMLLCYTPWLISKTITAFPHINSKNLETLPETVLFMNSSINPFLYCWRLRDLRAAVVKMTRQILCKQSEGN